MKNFFNQKTIVMLIFVLLIFNGFLIFMFLFNKGVFAFNAGSYYKSSGEVITADSWNGLMDDISSSQVPSGAVMSFYLNSCPSGWKAADGSPGTPDLRGQFVRGLNDFGTGTRIDGKQDPDGAARILGDYQSDELKSHNHSGTVITGSGATGSSGSARRYGSIGYTGGSETRSKNVALIYCVKE